MFHVVVIGAGQLGSRHLQALAKSDFPISLTVVDPSSQSLDLSRERFEEITPNPCVRSIDFIGSIQALKGSVDFGIIATSADVRFSVLSEFLDTVKVSNLLLEKVLFQSSAELSLASDMLRTHDVRAWVNCPRRIFPVYKQVKDLLPTDQPIHFSVVGHQWGLACNSIHFIDLFSWLSADSPAEIDISRLDPLVLKNKRSGFIELAGMLSGTFKRGGSFDLTDSDKFSGELKVTMQTATLKITVNEVSRSICVERAGGATEEWSFEFLFQSELTHLVARDVLLEKKCGLTPYADSANYHNLFLQAIGRHLEQIPGSKYAGRCPIT